jgi:hypothetical protein
LIFLFTKAKESIQSYLQTEPKSGNHGSILWTQLSEDGNVHLWSLDIKGSEYQIELPQRIYSKRCIGYPSPADWIVEAYWPERPLKEMKIADLQFFAAHAVLMSGKMNGRIVEGLEMVMCRSDKFEWVPEADITKFRERSNGLDAEIANRLFHR